MQHPTTASGNLRAGPARKRAVLRALRHFYLWGWVRYHGQLIQQESHLAAFFPKESVAAVKAILGTGRKWWYQQDPLLPFRRNDGQVHLPQRSSATPAACTQGLTLRMLTYNCRTLGYTQARLVEIAEDLHVRGIHVAALQCTCWKQDQVRHEWIVKGRHGQQLFHCISWRRDPSNVQTGVLLLLSCAVFDKAHIIWRLDPGHSAEGRFGGVRVVDRKSRQPHDHTFITAYAPQETAADEEKQVFSLNCSKHFMDYLHEHEYGYSVISTHTSGTISVLLQSAPLSLKQAMTMALTLLTCALPPALPWPTLFTTRVQPGGRQTAILRTDWITLPYLLLFGVVLPIAESTRILDNDGKLQLFEIIGPWKCTRASLNSGLPRGKTAIPSLGMRMRLVELQGIL